MASEDLETDIDPRKKPSKLEAAKETHTPEDVYLYYRFLTEDEAPGDDELKSPKKDYKKD